MSFYSNKVNCSYSNVTVDLDMHMLNTLHWLLYILQCPQHDWIYDATEFILCFTAVETWQNISEWQSLKLFNL